MAVIALECVGSHVPDREKLKYWLTQRRLILHAAQCWDAVVRGIMKDDKVAWALHSLGDLYSDGAKADVAEKMYQRAL